MYSILFARFPTVDYITDHKGKTGRKGGPTLVSFTQKDETMQNTKNPKKIKGKLHFYFLIKKTKPKFNIPFPFIYIS